MRNAGLGPWIHKRRVKSGGKPAIISGADHLDYGTLAERIDRLATVLERHGARAGDRVAYLGNNHPAFLETLFACGLLGAVFVPLNTRLPPRELNYQLSDAGASVLVNAEPLEAQAVAAIPGTGVVRRLRVATASGDAGSIRASGVVPGDDAAAAARPADGGAASTVPGDDGAAAARPADGGGARGVPVLDYEAELAGAAAQPRDAVVSLDDAAVILYTSGTTGRPKGAVLTHGNLTWNAINVLVDYDVTSTEVALMIAPMFHVASLGMGALPTLLKGGTLVLQDRFEPAAVLAAIERHAVTSLSGVPTTFQMLAEHPDWAGTDISSLLKLTCGGSAVPSRVSQAYEARGLSFSGGYGMTETSPGATSLQPERSRDKAGSAGLPHFFTEVRIVDPLGGEVAAGGTGEIQISGPNVIREYWNLPEASAEAIADGGWIRSGDIGHLDDDGFLYISDRLKDMIITGGENVYPAEIEQLIMELPEVSAVAVVGVPDERWGEVPRAVIVLAPGCSLDPEGVREHLDGRLARYKIPRTVEFVAEMPRTASGKIRKADLRQAGPRQTDPRQAGPRQTDPHQADGRRQDQHATPPGTR